MKKIKSGAYSPLPIVPIALVGANIDAKPNYLAVGCIGAVNHNPPIIMISLNKTHHTLKGIVQNNTFGINIPSSDQVIETDYCGVMSGKTKDKSSIFTTFYGDLETAPMIEECPINCECKLLDTKEFPQCISYYGEVHQVYFSDDIIKGKDFEFKKVNPIFLSGFENAYRDTATSKRLAYAYSVGFEYEKHRGLKTSKESVKGPRIIEKGEFQILGVEDINKIETRDPAAVWAKFQQVGSHIPHSDTSHALGIYINTKELLVQGKDRYIVGVEVSEFENVPEGMIAETIPRQTYALFTHIGPLSTLRTTHRYINQEWLPNNPKYERLPFGVEFEWYDSRFRFDSEYSEIDLYIPVKEK